MPSKHWLTSKTLWVSLAAGLYGAWKHCYIDKEGVLQFDESTALVLLAGVNAVLRVVTVQAIHFFAPDGQK